MARKSGQRGKVTKGVEVRRGPVGLVFRERGEKLSVATKAERPIKQSGISNKVQ